MSLFLLHNVHMYEGDAVIQADKTADSSYIVTLSDQVK